MSTAIWWIRRDLRLHDSQALAAALAQGGVVIPVFILDPQLLSSAYVSERRVSFLLAGLETLDQDLRARGSRLIVRRGDPLPSLAQLCAETGATAVYAEEDYSAYARRRDARVRERLPLQLVGGLSVFPPEAVCKQDGDPYTVFTPFSRAWKALPAPQRSDLLAPPDRLDAPSGISGEPLTGQPADSLARDFPAGEGAARARLEAFVRGANAPIFKYASRRDRPDLPATSQLSPYLRLGMLSLRTAVVAALEVLVRANGHEAQKGATTWLNELLWREFYLSILYHFPHVQRGSFRPQYNSLAWDNDRVAFEAWCAGRTGYPMVDAAMRQLRASGWMHNRTRMIVASFLVKDLLIDWRWGERWFMQQLLDGDPAANNGGWQWVAGTGTDAAPYFRVFNPTLQSQKFDPQGAYIRRWLPELAAVPDKYIHEPSTMPEQVQRDAACIIGADYPPPIIDHHAARERVLAAYKAVGDQEMAK